MSAEAGRQRRLAEAADAWERGRQAIESGDLAAARFWLERVGRIAPQDPRPRFEAALVLAAMNAPEAAEALHGIAREHDLAPAWLALARHAARNADHRTAAMALTGLFARHVVDLTPELVDLADRVATADGRAGWIAMSGSGLVVHGDGVRLSLDGRLVRHVPDDVSGFTLLEARGDGGALLGSPLDLARLRRHVGIAAAERGGIVGWVVRPAAPEEIPALTLVDRAGTRSPVRPRSRLDPDPASGFLPRHRFRIGAARLRDLVPPFRIEAADGAAIAGTPIDPAMPISAEVASGPAVPRATPEPAPLVVVMPVYRDEAATRIAVESVRSAVAPGTGFVVIDDGAPEPGLSRWLRERAAAGWFVLKRHRVNRGFPAAVNAGVRIAQRMMPGCDILLLNADIDMPGGASARLQAALYADADIASATPFSNEATILSYPSRQGGNPPPDRAGVVRLDALARRANGAVVVTIPTAIGFCMAIRHDALRVVGGFDSALFAQGYGEENDWCRRAVARGFRHVAVPGVFVAHHGGASFGAAGSALCARNLTLLERRHPGYHAVIVAHHAEDPLRRARFRLDRARFRAARLVGRRVGQKVPRSVVLVSHDHGGGIARIVAARMAAVRAEGARPVLIQPDFSAGAARESGIGAARVSDDGAVGYPNLCYRLPGEFAALVALLRAERPLHVEFHHMLGHDPSLADLPGALGVPVDYVVHDYAHFCKRVNLIGPDRRYCGEPDVAGCDACIARAGSELTDPISPARLAARSAEQLRVARRVSAPSEDTARRLRRHFSGITVATTPWEDDAEPVALRSPPSRGARVIAVVGGIGPAKGYDVLLACATDAVARNLGLRFVLFGTSEDDARLLQTGRVMITGAYQEGEATALIARYGADLGFLPSIWPETWCFALSELWRGGLYAIGFDLGAQAARIKATGRGFLLPLGLPADRINRTLLAWRPDLGNLNNRMQPQITHAFAAANQSF